MPLRPADPSRWFDLGAYSRPVDFAIAVDDPTSNDCRALLDEHLAFARAVTPPGHVHALGANALSRADVTFFAARRFGSLLAVGALRRLDDGHAEIKAMHTAASARGRGIGEGMVRHILDVAGGRGHERVSLETGTYPAFEPARRLYERLGFERCPPFAEYSDNPFSICMTRAVPSRPTSHHTPIAPVQEHLVEAFRGRARDQVGVRADAKQPSVGEAFGDSSELADVLAQLVVHGPKRATAGALIEYERSGETVPFPSMLSIATDGSGRPRALLETTEVRIGPLSSVDDAFAWDEGEGDRTRSWWLGAHERFFRRYLPTIGESFDPSMQTVFERFEVLYAED